MRILFVLLLVGPIAFADKPPAAWSAKMQRFGNLLQEILTVSADSREFKKTGNRKKFKKLALQFAKLSHKIDLTKMKKAGVPDPDPSIEIISGLFRTETDRVYSEARRGNYGYARRLVFGLTGYCMACHTTSNFGPAFSDESIAKVVKGLPTYEKASVLAALRKFDLALNEYEGLVKDRRFSRRNKIQWEEAVRRALILSVRVKKDSARTMGLVDLALKNPDTALFFRKDAARWKKSVQQWQAEPKILPKTEEGLFVRARNLLAQAKKKQEFSVDRGSHIDFLRASSAFHDLLRTHPKGRRANEALLYLGMSYEVMGDLDLWALHEPYYEMCVRRQPKSDLARQCYDRFERSIFFGYSGSGGISIPPDVEKRLHALRRLAIK